MRVGPLLARRFLMAFDAHTLAIEVVRALRDPVAKLRQRDPDLADQVRRAANSVALNLDEGRWRTGKDRSNRFRIAAGSAGELRTALQLAEDWGDVSPSEVAQVRTVLDRLIAILWRLLHPAPSTAARSSTASTPVSLPAPDATPSPSPPASAIK